MSDEVMVLKGRLLFSGQSNEPEEPQSSDGCSAPPEPKQISSLRSEREAVYKSCRPESREQANEDIDRGLTKI